MVKMPGFITILICVGAIASVNAGDCDLTIARLKYGGGGDWYANPSAYPNLAAAAREDSLPVCDTIAIVELLDDRLFRYPFLCMTGHGNVHFTPRERSRLRTFLAGGGFLWADDSYGMDTSFRREMTALFPENPLVPLPDDHPVFRERYALPRLPKIHEHDGKPAIGLGIFFDNRLVVFYSFSSDITDGLEDAAVHENDDRLRSAARRMGLNLLHWFLK